MLEEFYKLHVLFRRDLNATLFGRENVSMLLRWDSFLAFYNEAVQNNRKQLLQSRLNRAFDGQAFRVEDLEAALQDQVDKFLRELSFLWIKECEEHLEDPDLSHLVEVLTTSVTKHLQYQQYDLVVLDLEGLRDLLQQVHGRCECLGDFAFEEKLQRFEKLKWLILDL